MAPEREKQPALLATVHERMREQLAAGEPADGFIDADLVQNALGLRSRFLAHRVLIALSGPKHRFRSASEFVAAAEAVMEGPKAEKLAFLFRVYDDDGDGFIAAGELERYLHIAVAENDLHLSEGELDELVSGVMRAGDTNHDQRIDVFEFAQMMTSRPSMEQRLTEYGVALLKPGKRARSKRAETVAAVGRWRGWVRNDLLLLGWLLGYLGVCAALFTSAVLRYDAQGANAYVQVARGFGACLNFSCALIVVPMLRLALTSVRKSKLGLLAPVDDAIDLHRFIGETTCLFTLGHVGAHVTNIATHTLPWNTPANLTGTIMLVALATLWALSRERVRRSGLFELFFRGHLAYVVVIGLLFVHGPSFWLWGSVPWAWFVLERSLRMRRRKRPVAVLDTTPFASGVTRVTLERPHAFWYAPGDYAFLCIPSLARHEWHPFTLTSAPEDPERISVHVRSSGNWTRALGKHVAEQRAKGAAVTAHVDGPYATCSRELLACSHAVAIAGGIGVTPFASILQSLLMREGDANQAGEAPRKLRFVWLNREQHSFEWFAELLGEIERRDIGKRLDVHIFMTAGRFDMAGGLLDFARSLLQRPSRGDLVTGLRTKTALGAPDIDRLLESFAASPDLPAPEVFFCGPKSLEAAVAKSCKRLGLRLRSERF